MKNPRVYETHTLFDLIRTKLTVIEERCLLIWGATRMVSKSHSAKIREQAAKLNAIASELEQRIKLLEGERDVLKKTNAALWDRFLGRPPSARDVRNDVAVHTVDEVLRRLGDGTAQATHVDGVDDSRPGDGHWFG